MNKPGRVLGALALTVDPFNSASRRASSYSMTTRTWVSRDQVWTIQPASV